MKFERLKFYNVSQSKWAPVSQAIIFFANGFGASVTQYGSPPVRANELENYNVDVLVALKPRPKGKLGVDYEVFGRPVLGRTENLSREQVERALDEIAALPSYEPITGDTTVYSASAWWRDSDPSMQVVALGHGPAREAIEELMRGAAEDAYESDPYEPPEDAEESDEDEVEGYRSADEAMDDIAWSGVHAFALRDLASGRGLDEAIAALERDGIWYPDR